MDNKKIFNIFFKHNNPVNKDKELWPDSWKTIVSKSYERCPKLKINQYEESEVENTKKTKELVCILKNRTSALKDFKPLSRTTLLYLLKNSLGKKDNDIRRINPSAGALYPIDVYFISTATNIDIEPGIYYFSMVNNFLVLIKKIKPFEKLNEIIGSPQDFIKESTQALAFTYTPSRNVEKYGWFGVRAAFIEIGAMTQSLSLLSTNMGINTRQYGYADDNTMNETLGIDGINEIYVLGMIIG